MNYKGLLKERSDAHPNLPVPSYSTFRISAETQLPQHKSVLTVGSKTYSGLGTTKKQAEQAAAKSALDDVKVPSSLPIELSLNTIPNQDTTPQAKTFAIFELSVRVATNWHLFRHEDSYVALLNGQLLEKQNRQRLRETLSPAITITSNKNELINLIYFHLKPELNSPHIREIRIASHSVYTSPLLQESIKKLDKNDVVSFADTVKINHREQQ